MYQVTIFNDHTDQVGTVIQSAYPNGTKLSGGKVNLVIEGISSMSFSINMSNPGWGKIKPLKTLIEVHDVKRNRIVFSGRVLKPTQTMTSNGMFTIEYNCESKLAYLQDSNQRFGEYRNISVRDFFIVMINNHNRQVEPHKRFTVGNVTVTDPNDSLYRYLGYEKTFDTIKDKLIDRLGGFLVIREESDGNYIDYLESVGEVSNTPIQLRSNLKDMKRDIDPLDVITRLVVLGAKVESDNPDDAGASEARLTIESVNNGLDYMDDQELIEEFSVIEGTITYDDINSPSLLKTRGDQFFASQKAAKVSYTVTPVDVNLIDDSLDSFKVGNWHPIINPIFEIDELLQIVEQDIDLSEPTKSSLTIGEKYKTLTQYQRESNRKMRNVEQLEQTVANQTQSIGVLKQELTAVDDVVNTINQTLTDNDIPALQQAVIDLQTAISNLNEAIESVPVYDLATPTTDGLMAAEDKIKLDELENYDVATELTEGLMAANDKRKSNLITVENPIDLDEIMERIQELENPTP